MSADTFTVLTVLLIAAAVSAVVPVDTIYPYDISPGTSE